MAIARGDLPTAITSAKRLIEADPDRPEGYFMLGTALAESGHVAKAIPLIEAAVERGRRAEHMAQLAKWLVLLRREDQAATAARDAMMARPQDPLTFDTIGCVLARLGDHEGSLVPFASAVEGDSQNVDYRYNLAAASGFTGQVAQARHHYEAILALDPGNARVHYALAILSRQTIEANHVPRLEAALERAGVPGDRLRIRYALAKELEDLGDTAGSLRHLSAANQSHKETLGYSFAQDEAIFDALEALFCADAAPLAAGAGHGGAISAEAPIFVVGMPRTGTTLVDRILSSHPDVEAAGELQAMPLAVKQLAATASRRVLDAETVKASGTIDPAALREAYLARANVHRGRNKPRFTDKLPANFLYIGHILRALPNARVVCLRRGPLDTLWSNYKNLFASQSAYYAYSYDLMDTARYYARFHRLMERWGALWPGAVLQLSYEGLVADQEGETRRLLAHCGLDWDPACLDFHKNRAAVATPSAAQVRRPINSDGVGKWRAYAAALEPARRWLAQQGLATD
ncbi:tetratricopeptide repeat-containing sulfotransferase family protein [Novosphingobium gossypii]|uniref:tetratricopeptide repeat-containing sulfotransferase family protein n=1 Tax=Novosphingobium gossypii TaxID=1604774 RepID=UPI003D1B3786